MNKIVHEFFIALERCYAPLYTPVTDDVDNTISIGPGLDSDWVEWRPIVNSKDLSDIFSEFEKLFNQPLPSLFKEWYATYCTLSVDIGFLRFPANPPRRLGGPLLDFAREFIEDTANSTTEGLLPFADEGFMGVGPVCFDSTADASSEGWPIVLWDRERQTKQVLFSNFAKTLESCIAYMNRFAELKAAASEDRNDWRSVRSLCVTEVIKCDPSGAGGAGMLYWKQWITN